MKPPPTGTDIDTPLTEAEKAARLLKMRRVALGLLLVMAVVFIASKSTEHLHPAIGYIRAFSEAAIVGGLADWFAVTALFRYPMGIPLPHTAVIPRSKQKIGRALGQFVQTNFLAPDVVESRLKKADLSGSIGQYLADPTHAAAVADRLVDLVPAIVDAVDDKAVAAYLERTIQARLEQIDVEPIVGNLLANLPSSVRHEAVIDQVIDLAVGFLEENRESLREKIGDRTEWWVPNFVDQRIFDSLIAAIEDLLSDLRIEGNERRALMGQAVRTGLSNLRHDPAFMARFNELKAEVLRRPEVRGYFADTWTSIKAILKDDIAAPKSAARVQFARLIATVGRALQDDPTVKEKVDEVLHQAIVRGLVPFRDEFGEMIVGVVEGWDARVVTEKIELNVGRDLQFIRVNGTLVGGLVGLTVHALWEALT